MLIANSVKQTISVTGFYQKGRAVSTGVVRECFIEEVALELGCERVSGWFGLPQRVHLLMLSTTVFKEETSSISQT